MLDFYKLVSMWDKAKSVPGGRQVFSRAIRFFVPYTGTLGATIETLERGRCKVRMSDRRIVRNHLKSVHAMALANLGEMATGIAVNTALPADARAILTGFSIRYLKKGRGDLTAEATYPLVDKVTERKPVMVSASVKDSTGAEIATVEAEWLTGPKHEKKK